MRTFLHHHEHVGKVEWQVFWKIVVYEGFEDVRIEEIWCETSRYSQYTFSLRRFDSLIVIEMVRTNVATTMQV